ncbi:MAG TPA: hypothetical protein VF527_07865 [Pyrinomonadaceae bacterium]|jgi:ketosteroid isomerase-like protein
MKKLTIVFVSVLCAALACLGQTASTSPAQRRRTATPPPQGAGEAAATAAQLTGLYRIDLARSDKLYSVVAGASSNLPFGEQQKFFIDLTVRLTPPDLLAIERRGRRITLASSRAPRIDFDADGIKHSERGGDGQIVNTLAALQRGGGLTVSVSGQSGDKFNVTFEPLEGGRSLRVTRRLNNEQLTQPVLIHSVYEKISGVPQWDIYDAPPRRPDLPPARPPVAASPGTTAPPPPPRAIERDQAAALRRALDDWIAATNARDIDRQMSFYPPVVRAFYLQRNASRGAVRAEKERVFLRAQTIDVRADAPELIFQDGGRAAVMRFRKTYAIKGGGQTRRGEVIQELRWQLTPQGWKIYSERDVRVIR